MPAISIEFDDKGDPVGDLPTEIHTLLKRTEADTYKTAYGKGVEQAAKDAKKQIEDAIAIERKRLETMEPLEKERVARIQQENESLVARLNDLSKESDRSMRAREEAHARELLQRTEQVAKRNERILALTRSSIRVDAVQAGARDESLEELEIIVGNYLGFDDDMQPFIKGQDGQPMTVAGKPVTIGSFVKQYLDAHPHHRKASAGRGGDARRGASFTSPGGAQSADAVKARIEAGDRSPAAINDLFNASRKTSVQ